MLYQILTFLVEAGVTLVGGACLVRAAMRWRGMSMSNPLGELAQALSDWLVQPLRRLLPVRGGLDLASLLAAWLLKLLQYAMVLTLIGAPRWGVLPVVALVDVARLAITVAMVIVIVAALFSWSRNQTLLAQVLRSLAEPLLAPFRRWLPLVGGFDLSPLLALILLQVLSIVLASLEVSLLGTALPLVHR